MDASRSLVERLRRRLQPTTWSLLWGTISAGCFLALVITGVILMIFYDGSGELVTYGGGYALLRGTTMSRALASTLWLSFDVPGGLLVRQAHHWAALMLPASLLLQLAGAFFTGAFRRPRRVLWVLTVATFLVVLVAGWSGYALPDDNLSGTGLRIVQGTTLAVPFVGTWVTWALFGGEFPGRIIEHLYPIHLLASAVTLGLVALRLRLAWRLGPVQLPGPGRTADRVVGLPLWPQAAVRVGGLLSVTLGVITLLAGTLTISPVWRYGPSSPGNAYAGSQPDWYTAFLDGALRLVPPGWEVTIAGRTWAFAVLVPLAAIGLFFALLTLWPYVEERFTHDSTDHQLLERPRDNPTRTGIGAAGVTFYAALWAAGSADILATQFAVSFEGVILTLRTVVLAGPVTAYLLGAGICRALCAVENERGRHGVETGAIVRLPGGGYVELSEPRRDAATGLARLEPTAGDQQALVGSPPP